MGIFSIANQHIRFAVKLATAIVLALFVGFHFQLETPRWAVLTAAIVAAGPAFDPTVGFNFVANQAAHQLPDWRIQHFAFDIP